MYRVVTADGSVELGRHSQTGCVILRFNDLRARANDPGPDGNAKQPPNGLPIQTAVAVSHSCDGAHKIADGVADPLPECTNSFPDSHADQGADPDPN